MFLDTAGSASNPVLISVAMPKALEAPVAWEASQREQKGPEGQNTEIRRQLFTRSSNQEEPWADELMLALSYSFAVCSSQLVDQILDSYDRIVSEGKGGTDFLRTVESQYPLSRRQLGIKQTRRM